MSEIPPGVSPEPDVDDGQLAHEPRDRIFDVLAARGVSITAMQRAWIASEQDLGALERLRVRAMQVEHADQLFDES